MGEALADAEGTDRLVGGYRLGWSGPEKRNVQTRNTLVEWREREWGIRFAGSNDTGVSIQRNHGESEDESENSFVYGNYCARGDGRFGLREPLSD